MTPLFSIIIPLYNKEKHIAHALDSVLAQSHTNFEIIIVNDGSTDQSLNIVNSYNDDRILVFSKKNTGVSYARNYGITKSKSDYIVFLDADDYWKSHHLSDLRLLLETHPNCGLYAKAYIRKFEKFEIPSIYNGIPNNENWMGVLNDYFYNCLGNSISLTSAVMVKKTIINSIGNFNEKYNSGEDTDLWIRIALNHSVAFYNKVSVIHNLKADNKITDTAITKRKLVNFNSYNSFEKTNNSLKRYLDLNRYAFAIEYKLEKDYTNFKNQVKAIDYNSLSLAKKLSLILHPSLLNLVIKMRNKLRILHIDLRLFR